MFTVWEGEMWTTLTLHTRPDSTLIQTLVLYKSFTYLLTYLVHFRCRYRDSIAILDTWGGIVIVAPILGIAQHYLLCRLPNRIEGSHRLRTFILLPRPRYVGGRGIVFERFLCLFMCLCVSFFLSLFVSLLARLRENGWTDLHEILNFQGRCGVTMGRPDYIFGQFREAAQCREAQHGDGVCCAFAPQLVWLHFILQCILYCIFIFLYCITVLFYVLPLVMVNKASCVFLTLANKSAHRPIENSRQRSSPTSLTCQRPAHVDTTRYALDIGSSYRQNQLA